MPIVARRNVKQLSGNRSVTSEQETTIDKQKTLV